MGLAGKSKISLKRWTLVSKDLYNITGAFTCSDYIRDRIVLLKGFFISRIDLEIKNYLLHLGCTINKGFVSHENPAATLYAFRVCRFQGTEDLLGMIKSTNYIIDKTGMDPITAIFLNTFYHIDKESSFDRMRVRGAEGFPPQMYQKNTYNGIYLSYLPKKLPSIKTLVLKGLDTDTFGKLATRIASLEDYIVCSKEIYTIRKLMEKNDFNSALKKLEGIIANGETLKQKNDTRRI